VKAALRRLSATLEPHALVILAGAGVLGFVLYLRLIVQPANLMLLYTRPLVDLGHILDSSAPAALNLMLLFLAETLLYGVAWWAVQRVHNRDAWLLVFAWTAVFGGALLLQYPYGAADIFDNILHGRILGIYGQNPFIDLIAAHKDDPFYAYAYWKTAPSAYGPLWELLAGLTARLAGDGILTNILLFKLVPALFLFASMGMVALILRAHAPERALAGVLLLGWNPMIQFEVFGNGHNDIVMIFWALLATWALTRRRYTLAILALVTGMLIKYIPVLFIPAAGWIALRQLDSWPARMRFVALTALASLALTVAAFAPFWNGIETLTIARRAQMFTASLPSIFYLYLGPSLGDKTAGAWVSGASAVFTLLFALLQAWRAGHDPSWLSFPRSAFNTLMFYLLLACPWFQVWYAIWPLTLAVLFPLDASLGLALLFSLTMLLKPFVIRPLFFWQGPAPSRLWRESHLMLGILGLPWLYSLWILLRSLRRSRRTPAPTQR